ncbi:MAG: hypothetical protein GWN00_37100, partial [Aliifodinibius sp.]|nr:hypothetical protein [Fodinibius sp.]NIW50118.1 hypothetical protein [Gammaproteobacteria bacterium]NIY30201.1 hypothetical protein [Fodinibius sp.]
MTTPLCLLNQATEEPWKYRNDEYEYYLLDLQPILLAWPDIFPMTLEEFEAKCDDPFDPYLGTKQMYDIVQDLLLALKKIKPPATWWYYEENTWLDFEDLLE